MIIKVKQMMALDVNLHWIAETPYGLVLFKTSIAASMVVSAVPTIAQINKFFSELLKEPVQIEHIGHWDNIRDVDGMIDHPFDVCRVHWTELKILDAGVI